MTGKKVAIVGDGKIATDCLSAVEKRTDMELCAYVYHGNVSWSARGAEMLDTEAAISCKNVNDAVVVRTLEEMSPDIIVNVNSFDILRDQILNVPSDGVVNFHNGPLPDYRGMNIPTWAIFNGESEHGITWHRVERTIDTGAILTQERFAIDSGDTAILLIFKCLAAGLRQFEVLLDNYAAAGVLNGTPQSGRGRYYRSSDMPNDGLLDFTWPRNKLLRFVRSLTFRPFPDSRLRIRFRVGDQMIYAGNVEVPVSQGAAKLPGTVIGLSAEQLTVATKDSTIIIEDLTDENGTPITTKLLAVKPGQQLL